MNRLIHILFLALAPAAFAGAPTAQLLALLEPEVPVAVQPTSAPSLAPVAALPAAALLAPTPATTPATMELDRTAILDLLTRRLADHYHLNGELRLLPQGRIASVPVSGAYDLRIVSAPVEPSRTFAVRYQIVCDQVIIYDATVNLSAEHWLPVYVARQQAQKGSSPYLADLVEERVDTLQVRYTLVEAGTDLSQYELALPTAPNRALGWRNLAPRPLVKKGAVVEARVEQGTLNISLPALALQDGREGELIRVRNLQSRKDFNARVTHENVVRVTY